MQVKLVLFGMVRERLAKETRGRLTVEMPEGSTIANLLTSLDVRIAVICSLNGQIERDFGTELHEGDELQIFQPVGGGCISGTMGCFGAV
jgi:sulfur carrier protein ThiS